MIFRAPFVQDVRSHVLALSLAMLVFVSLFSPIGVERVKSPRAVPFSPAANFVASPWHSRCRHRQLSPRICEARLIVAVPNKEPNRYQATPFCKTWQVLWCSPQSCQLRLAGSCQCRSQHPQRSSRAAPAARSAHAVAARHPHTKSISWWNDNGTLPPRPASPAHTPPHSSRLWSSTPHLPVDH